MRIPAFSDDILALIGGAILLAIGLSRSRRANGRFNVVYIGAGAVLLVIGVIELL
ncbi:MAG: hypothetical protein LKI24_17595 [Acidipropionibacterium sp.]|jgi:hypothetical protein|nr:hypothetical protein [Acidipropionibacterium sp.]